MNIGKAVRVVKVEPLVTPVPSKQDPGVPAPAVATGPRVEAPAEPRR